MVGLGKEGSVVELDMGHLDLLDMMDSKFLVDVVDILADVSQCCECCVYVNLQHVWLYS